ncbi:arylamine N-acetyltransferase 1 [Coprinopsis marcescibilis]|uniref:Arylamine N-acetyltransferase 1 n=1 Tax=Coprinopsis marcescibilis TaxID=230819 RepID=A0A5C3KTG3_COPMA|nr:arylamine N-acetyltransferase 1 [Coprinopsis marcescibilis]
MPSYLQNQARIKQIPSFYTPSQVARYLAIIKFEPTISTDDVTSQFQTSAENLERVVHGHLLTFPWENTAMHYTHNHNMDISPDGLYRRFIDEGKGSYCFGQNTLLLGILRGLGYRAYSGAARVNANFQHPEKEPDYTFLTHMVVFVQPGSESRETLVVDVGFGAYGLVRPIPLSESQDSWVYGAFSTEAHRLTRTLPFNSSLDASGQKKWNLEIGSVSEDGVPQHDKPWKLMYSFTEEEFSLRDYEDANVVVSHNPRPNFFSENVLAVKYIRDEKSRKQGDMSRVTLLGKEVRRIGWAGSEVLCMLETELDRLDALKRYFGIDIPREDIANIQGRHLALPL